MKAVLMRAGGVAALMVAVACGPSPVAPAGPVTVTTAALTLPASGAVIPHASQPVTLQIANATVATHEGGVTYTFEVASDAGFVNKVATADVPEGSSGSTSLTLGPLPGGVTYYWHTRTSAGGTVGVFGQPRQFSIGPAIVINAPTPQQPASGVAGLSVRPTFVVTNATRTGPVTTISYRFEVSLSSTFAALVTSATIPEGTTTTSWTPSFDLSGASTYFWRVQAVDAGSSITSPYSATRSFTTQVAIDLRTVNWQRFPDVSGWPQTDTIIAVEQDGSALASPPGAMCINHTKRGVWPTTDFFGDPETQVESNQWYFAFINNRWYAGSGENMRPNQICKEGQTSDAIGPDGTWGGPMDTWRPRAGELVGYMVTTPARWYPAMQTVNERSNVIVQPWVDSSVHAAASIKR